MEDYQKLIHRLEHLKKTRTKAISLDVVFLLDLLKKCEPRTQAIKVTPLDLHRHIDVDGGNFTDG